MQSHMASWPIGGRRPRSRVVFSCLSCHTRKIKCDRNRPCRRCVAAGRGAECEYQTQQMSPLSADVASTKFSSLTLFVRGKARMGTATSWIRLMWEFEEARPYLFGLDFEYKEMFDKIRRLKDLFRPARDVKFPFMATASAPGARSQLLSRLPKRRAAEILLNGYLETFEVLFPLWHQSSYVDEMAQFWKNPEAAEWTFLSQIFMMMALGCQCISQEQLKALELNYRDSSQLYFDLAGNAFASSQFMVSYDLAGLRTLCMSILARMMDLITPDDERDCSISVGLTVRIAQAMNMHRHPSLFSGMLEVEMANRIKIWTTLVFLDILASIHSSLPPVVRSEDYDAGFRVRDQMAEIPTVPPDTEDGEDAVDLDDTSFQHILADFLPTASYIVSMANSANRELDYINVELHDRWLRKLLSKAIGLHNSSSKATSYTREGYLRSEMLQIIIRRVMLILHEPFGRKPNAALNFRTSHIALLECSLALAVSQGSLYEGSHLGDTTQWALNLFKEHFKTALVCIALGIRQQSFDVEDLEISSLAPTRIAWITLRRAVEITERQAGDSVKHFMIYLGVIYLVAALESLESRTPMRDKMFEAGQIVISSMEKIRGCRLGDYTATPPSLTASQRGNTAESRPEQAQNGITAYGTGMIDNDSSIFS
ncbi:unnamed protein product [Clonostachys rosea]|uniref:Zn(2)-C6 fungal-type domain-containing protein n=1 Tax=Bionectria ochroleuca TaxID=29856 RepID=A0ABY6TYZ8_BIOOC|nr:unnamed protein product [Clonostachys rosea]